MAFTAVVGVLAAALAGSTHAAVQPAKPGDFNGDGYPDLAVGAWKARPKPFTRRRNGGGIGLVYGGKSVLGTKTQLLHRAVGWVPGPQSTNTYFGAAVTAC